MVTAHVNPHGVIDETLAFLVTSFQLSGRALSDLPEWTDSYKPNLSPSYENSPRAHLPMNDSSTQILGTGTDPIREVSAIKVGNDLKTLGYVPCSLYIYIKKVRYGRVTYRLNIRWARPTDDKSQQLVDSVRYQELYEYLQKYFSWSMSVTENVTHNTSRSANRTRSIVFNFRNRKSISLSGPKAQIVIRDRQIIRDKTMHHT